MELLDNICLPLIGRIKNKWVDVMSKTVDFDG